MNFEYDAIPLKIRRKDSAHSISDFAGHYDIDGVSYRNGKIFIASGVWDGNSERDQPMEVQKRVVRKLTIRLHGLGCGGGGSLQLEKQIKKLMGVEKVYVNPATSEAYLDVRAEFNVDELLNLTKSNGFKFDQPKWD